MFQPRSNLIYVSERVKREKSRVRENNTEGERVRRTDSCLGLPYFWNGVDEQTVGHELELG